MHLEIGLAEALVEYDDVPVKRKGDVPRGAPIVASATSRSALTSIIIQKEWANEGFPVAKPWDIIIEMRDGLTYAKGRVATGKYMIEVENDSKQAARDDFTWAVLEIIRRVGTMSRAKGQWKMAWYPGTIFKLFEKEGVYQWERRMNPKISELEEKDARGKSVFSDGGVQLQGDINQVMEALELMILKDQPVEGETEKDKEQRLVAKREVAERRREREERKIKEEILKMMKNGNIKI